MARTQKKQSAITFEEFQTIYETTLNDTSRPWDERNLELKALEKKHIKAYSRYMLRTGFGALREGGTVYVIERRRSRTSYSRTISLYTFVADDPNMPDKPTTASLTYHVAKLLGYTCHDFEGRHVLRTDDYPQEFVSHVSQALFGVDKANALRCEVL